MNAIRIRQAAISDIDHLWRVASHHPPDDFKRYLAEQQDKKRIVLAAEQNGAIVGYVNLLWSPTYAPFKRLDIPEIQDLNVISAARRQGVGRQLVEACESLARQAGKTDIGIAVGLYPAYGPAQRLYVKMGYIPDGAGVCHDDIPVRAGELKPVDDQMTIKLIKTL